MVKISKVIGYSFLFSFTIFSAIFLNYYLDQVKYTGKILLNNKNLSGPIQIYTDENGFVHINAETRKDAFFALGVSHARDRLFSMDLQRRIALGKLSEFFGEKTLSIDKISRAIGFGRVGENDVKELLKIKEHKEINEIMQVYCDGINYWADNHYLPIEYHIIRAKWKKWTMTDSFAFFRFMDWSMSGDHSFEIIHHLIHDFMGQNAFELFYKTILYDFPYFNDTYISETFLKEHNLTTKSGFALNLDNFIEKIGIPEIKYRVSSINQKEPKGFEEVIEGQASNSWMVHGKHTNTGKPIFSNDPHLQNRIPGIHYIVKLYIGKNKNDKEIIVGSAPPACPLVIIGNNKYLAYGFTTDYRDRSDYVEELLDYEDISKANYYFIDNKKYSLNIRTEKIKIRGKPDLNYKIKLTRNGPLLEGIPKEWNGLGFDFKYVSENKKISNALSYNFFAFKKILRIDLLYKRMFSKKKEDFLGYTKEYIGPPFSFSWATVEGEIGYTPISQYPLKKNPKQIFSKGYNSSEYDSTTIDFIPIEDVPVLINPEKGYFATANSHPIHQTWKYFSTSYEIPWRHHRINQLLDSIIKSKKYSVADSVSILSDTHDSLCEIILPDLIKTLKKYIYPKLYSYRYLELLKNFDCNMTKKSRGATVYEILVYKLVQYLLLKNEANGVNSGFNNEDEINSLINKHWLFLVLYKIVHASTKVGGLKFFKNCEYFVKGHHCEEYIIDVFQRLYNYFKKYNLIETIKVNGKEEETVKKWGDINRHYYSSVFEKVPILKWFFTRSNPTDGNKNTIKVARNDYSLDLKNPFNSVHSANMKYINDLNDITRPYICIDLGNSGNILSKYYTNLMIQCEKNHLIKIIDYEFSGDQNKELILSPIN